MKTQRSKWAIAILDREIALLCLMLLVFACSLGPSDSRKPGEDQLIPSPIPTLPHLPTAQPRPSFIKGVTPLESSTVPYQTFIAPSRDKTCTGTGVWYDSEISVKVDVGPPLWEPGDDLTAINDVRKRVVLYVDGKRQPKAVKIFKFVSWLEDDERKWEGPYTFYWKVELDVGIHMFTFEFHQTSGNIQRYTWYLEITEKCDYQKENVEKETVIEWDNIPN